MYCAIFASIILLFKVTFFLNSSFFLNLFLDQISIVKGLFNFNYFSEPESLLSDIQWNLFLMAQIRNNFSPRNLQGLSCSLLHDFCFHFKHNILILNCNSELYYIYLFATSLMIMNQKGRGYISKWRNGLDEGYSTTSYYNWYKSNDARVTTLRTPLIALLPLSPVLQRND